MKLLQRQVIHTAFFFTLIMFFTTGKAQNAFVTSDAFRNAQFRGFNSSLIQSYKALEKKNLKELRATGANHTRIWVHVVHDAGNRYYFKIPTAISTIDSAIKVAEKAGLYLILTVEFLPKQGKDDWWGNSVRKANMAKFWADSLASRYKNSRVIAAYDLMNEPRKVSSFCSTREYIEFQYQIISAIRKVDPNHVIVVEVLKNQMLGDLAIREDSVLFKQTLMNVKNLVYSPHGYSPLLITHQGVIGSARQVYPQATGEFVAGYFKNVSYWNEPAIFQKKYNAVIWVGEFACINWAPQNDKGEWTSTRWTDDAINYMESLGWSWCGHAWREYQGWDAEVSSSWYQSNATYNDGKPSKLPPASARTDTAPTLMVYKQYFAKNTLFYKAR